MNYKSKQTMIFCLSLKNLYLNLLSSELVGSKEDDLILLAEKTLLQMRISY